MKNATLIRCILVSQLYGLRAPCARIVGLCCYPVECCCICSNNGQKKIMSDPSTRPDAHAFHYSISRDTAVTKITGEEKKKAIKRRESDECLVSQCLIHISIACCMRSDATEENDIENEGNTAKKKKNGRIFYCENSCHSQRSPQRGTTMVYTPHMNGER